MKTSTVIALFGVVGGWTMVESTAHGQPAATTIAVPAGSRIQETLDQNAGTNTFTFIVFYKEDSPLVREMLNVTRQGVVGQTERASVITANANDPAEKEIVDRFGISRAPMPLALAIAPNGAITGIFSKKITPEHIDAAIVTPTMARCMKSLQNKKLVFVIAGHKEKSEVPTGVRSLQKDPEFSDRIVLSSLRLDDPAEKRFITQMKIDPAQVNGAYAVLIAPPGVLVGHFDESDTAAEIASAIHKSGQCCDDPNCKHNSGSAQQAAQPSNTRKN